MKNTLGISLFILGVIIITIFSSGSGNIDKQDSYYFIETPTLIEEKNDYYSIKYIVGVLKNNDVSKTNYVQVTFNLYDKEGNVIGTALDNINTIEPNGTWKFKAIVTIDKFDSFKLVDVAFF